MGKYKINFYKYKNDIFAAEIRGDLKINSKIDFKKYTKNYSFEIITKEDLSCDCEFYSKIENYINKFPENNIFVIDNITNMISLYKEITMPVIRIRHKFDWDKIKEILEHYLNFLIDSKL